MTHRSDSCTNASFAARIRSGDTDALADVVRTYRPQIYRAGLGAGLDRWEAEDLAQDTLHVFLESASRFEGRSHVRTWLFGIFYRKLREFRRRHRRDLDLENIDEVFESRFREDGRWARPPRAPLRRLLDGELSEKIAKCLDEVPEKHRLALQLSDSKELGASEICNVLGVSATNLRVMLHRLRNRMRECLEAMGMIG